VAVSPATERMRILAVHEDPTMVLFIKRTLEPCGWVEITGARSAPLALDRLAGQGELPQAVLLHWAMPDLGALSLMSGLEALGPRRPWAFAFTTHWSEDELARALQIGVDALMGSPLTIEALSVEVQSLKQRGEAFSRSRLIHMAGARLLRQDERLWNLSADEAWRRRMSELAGRVHGRAAEAQAKDGQVLLARLDALFGRPIADDVVKLLRLQLDTPQQTVEALARTSGVPVHRARAYLGVLDELFASGNPKVPYLASVRGALTFVQGVVAHRVDVQPLSQSGWTRLQALAADVLAAGDTPDPSLGETLDRTLAEVLRVPVSMVTGLPSESRSALVASVLLAEDQLEMVDRGRLALLQQVLQGLPEIPIDLDRLRCLAAALGAMRPPDPGAAARLAGLLVDGSAEGLDIDTARLKLLEEALRRAPEDAEVDSAALVARLEFLRRALDPGAEVDLRRIERLVDHWNEGRAERVGVAVVGALVRAIARSQERLRPEPAVERFFRALGVTDREVRDRLHRTCDTLRGLRPAYVGDSDRLRHLFLRILAEPEAPTAERLRVLLAEADMVVSLERAAVGRSAEIAPPRENEARVKAHLHALARVLDVPLERLTLPADEVERLAARFGPSSEIAFAGLPDDLVLRLRTLATALARSGRDAGGLVQRYISAVGRDVRQLTALVSLLDGPAHMGARAALREALGVPVARAGAADVERLLASGQLEGAALALGDLADRDPRLTNLLNEVALALRNAGRGAEGEPLFKRALGVQPKRLNLLFNCGRMYHEAGRLEEALERFQAAVELAPDFALAVDALAQVSGALRKA